MPARPIYEKKLTTWDEFPKALIELKAHMGGGSFNEPLYRGLGNSQWLLETTLERSVDGGATKTLFGYYRAIARSKPVVESLTNRAWDHIPDFPVFQRLLNERDWLDQALSDNSAIYQYLIYLRHHGFPSPLLDWSASPYIAAMFAFDGMDKNAADVLIYAYVRNQIQGHGSDSHLFVVGPYVRTHPRHFSQQSRYTLCVQHNLMDPQRDYIFLPHAQVLENSGNDDLIVKIVIPSSERQRALLELDSMNINPYALYGSEESLIRTVARRELLFKAAR